MCLQILSIVQCSLLYSASLFFSFRRYNNDSLVSTNSRLYSLLEMFGTPERLLMANEKVDECLRMEINFDAVHKKIEDLREKSVEMLKEACVGI